MPDGDAAVVVAADGQVSPDPAEAIGGGGEAQAWSVLPVGGQPDPVVVDGAVAPSRAEDAHQHGRPARASRR